MGEVKVEFQSHKLPAFAEMFARVFDGKQVPQDEFTHLLVATNECSQAEAFCLCAITGKRAYLAWGGIEAMFRGMGRASAYLKLAFYKLKTIGVEEVSIMVRRDNIAMQLVALRNGFKIIGVNTGYDDDMKIVMWRAI